MMVVWLLLLELTITTGVDVCVCVCIVESARTRQADCSCCWDRNRPITPGSNARHPWPNWKPIITTTNARTTTSITTPASTHKPQSASTLTMMMMQSTDRWWWWRQWVYTFLADYSFVCSFKSERERDRDRETVVPFLVCRSTSTSSNRQWRKPFISLNHTFPNTPWEPNIYA